MRIYIKTFGCSANFHDSEVMGGLLREEGYATTNSADKADVVIVNICTVKGETKAIREITKQKGRIIVAGCITESIKRRFPELEFLDTHHITGIVDLLKRRRITEGIKINLPKVRRNPMVSIIPISSGCINRCAYCSVKLIKGELKSYPKTKIIKEVEHSIKDGCKELWITSQDNSVYGLDLYGRLELPQLLKEIVKVEGDFLIRIGMMNPDTTIKIRKELAAVYKSGKVFKFLHIPVQSGCDKILRLMNRRYKVKDFISLIRYFRREVPNITISTDIIVGFPTETKGEFNESVELIRKIKPDVLNLSRYTRREGTAAQKMKQIPGWETKRRSRILTKMFDEIALEKNRKWIGWEGEVIIDEKGKNSTYVGRNICYRPIIVKRKVKLGETVRVRIKKATKHDLRA